MSHVWPNPAQQQERDLYRLHPDLVAVQTAGRVELIQAFNTGSARVWRSHSRMMPRLLAHFRSANSGKSWTASRHEREQTDAAALLNTLIEAGYIVHAATPPQGQGAPPQAQPSETDALLQAIVSAAHQLRSDLLAIGGPAAEPAASAQNEPKLESWLQASYRMLQEVTQRVARVRAAQIQTPQVCRIDPSAPLKLHLGCGAHFLPGWVNIDVTSGDLRLDLRHGLPFADQSVEIVYLGHVLEHFDYPEEALALLKELQRTLICGGVMRITVPDIESFAQAYVERDADFFAHFEQQWHRPDAPSLLASFLHYAGAGGFPHVLDRHRFGYDAETLSDLLGQAGFGAIRRCLPGDSGDDSLDYSWAVVASANGRPFTLIMEARKI